MMCKSETDTVSSGPGWTADAVEKPSCEASLKRSGRGQEFIARSATT